MRRRLRRPSLWERIYRAFFEKKIVLRDRSLEVQRIDYAEIAMENDPLRRRR